MNNETAAPAADAPPEHERALKKFCELRADLMATMGSRRPLQEEAQWLRTKIASVREQREELMKHKSRLPPEGHAAVDKDIAMIDRRLAGFLLADEAARSEMQSAEERCEDLNNTVSIMREHLEKLDLIERGVF